MHTELKNFYESENNSIIGLNDDNISEVNCSCLQKDGDFLFEDLKINES